MECSDKYTGSYSSWKGSSIHFIVIFIQTKNLVFRFYVNLRTYQVFKQRLLMYLHYPLPEEFMLLLQSLARMQIPLEVLQPGSRSSLRVTVNHRITSN